jgi:type II secretory pathway pseudopilin PulG
LLELVIVVAVIATLALLATTYYQGAVVRSKVSRAKADMAALRSAIQAYATDNNLQAPTLAGGVGLSGALELLTRPEPYLGALPKDPFTGQTYQYLAVKPSQGMPRPYFGRWILSSAGPDGAHDTRFSRVLVYDPTNGLLSNGDIVVAERPW